MRFCLVLGAFLLHSISANLYFLFPAYIDALGGGLFLVGLIAGAASVGSVLARPIAGRVIDRHGRRLALIGGSVMHVTALIAMAFVSEAGLVMTVIRLCQGFAFAVVSSGLLVYAADILPPAHRLSGMSYVALTGMASIGLSSQIGDFAIAELGFAAFLFIGVGTALVGSIVVLFLPETRQDTGGSQGGFVAQLLAPHLRGIWVVTLCFALAISAVFTFAEPHIREINGLRISTFLSTYTVFAITVRLSIGWVSTRAKPALILAISLVLMCFGLGLLGLSTQPLVLIAAAAFIGVAHGYISPILSMLIVERGHPDARGASIAVYIGLIDVSPLLIGPVAGALLAIADFPAIFLAAAIFPLLGLVAALNHVSRTNGASHSENQP